MPPRALGAPLHRHSREDEYSFVVEGRVGALLGEEVVYGQAGDLIFKPRNQWHTFWNAGDERARILEIISPAGFERYFDELSDALASTPEPDPVEIAVLATATGSNSTSTACQGSSRSTASDSARNPIEAVLGSPARPCRCGARGILGHLSPPREPRPGPLGSCAPSPPGSRCMRPARSPRQSRDRCCSESRSGRSCRCGCPRSSR